MEHRTSRNWPTLLWLTFFITLSGICVLQSAALLKHGRDNAALIMAVKQNDTSHALALLNRGADSNATDNYGRRFLWRRVFQRVWYRLSGKKPPPEAAPTALLVLCKAKRDRSGDSVPPGENLLLLLALLDKGAHVDAVDSAGYTPLSYAVAYGNWSTARILVERGADVNGRGYDEQPILTSAIYDPSLVRLLLDRGARVEARSATGCTALMMASEFNEAASVRLLLAKGADIEATDGEGNTALMYAIENYAEACVQVLLSRGAKTNRENKRRQTPLEVAQKQGDPIIILLLKQAGAKA